MLVKFSKWLLVVALCASIGAHWTLLQSAAWVGMTFANWHESASLTLALARTFDGRHPCKLCKVVAAGKKSERRQNATLKVCKTELSPPTRTRFALSPPHHDHARAADAFAADRREAPPLPPPRGA